MSASRPAAPQLAAPSAQARAALARRAAGPALRSAAAPVARLARVVPRAAAATAGPPPAATPNTPGSPRCHGATPPPVIFAARHSSDGGRSKSSSTRAQASKSSAWETLGLKANANTAQIKKAYRKLVMLYHPDVAQEDNTEEKFQLIHEAYLILQGKLDGRAASGTDKAWDFHDWYWNFAAQHRTRRGGGHGDGAFSRRSEGQQAVSRAQVSQQLQHLKARARCRARTEAARPEAVPPPEVHPAWAAVSSPAHDEPEAEVSRGSTEAAPSHKPPVSEPEREAHHHPHRPPGIGRGHLASQLSGLRRKAQLRDQVAA